MNIEFEKIEDNKVVISMDDFEDMLDALAFDAVKDGSNESFPENVALRLIEGEVPVRVFREYRGLTQAALADQVGVSQAAIAEIESGRKNGSTKTLRNIANALTVQLDDLV